MSAVGDSTGRGVSVRESPIEGLGLFAARDFSAGQCIRQINVVREVTAETPLNEADGEFLHHCAYPRGKVFLIGSPDRHVNHSCDPNAYKREINGGSYYYTLRDILPGQEITLNYSVNTSGGTTWGPCNCGSRQCLQVVHGDFFDLPIAKQLEYLPLLLDWFTEAHHDRVEALRGMHR